MLADEAILFFQPLPMILINNFTLCCYVSVLQSYCSVLTQLHLRVLKMHMRLTLEPKVVGSIKKRTKFVNKEKRSWLVLAL